MPKRGYKWHVGRKQHPLCVKAFKQHIYFKALLLSFDTRLAAGTIEELPMLSEWLIPCEMMNVLKVEKKHLEC